MADDPTAVAVAACPTSAAAVEAVHPISVAEAPNPEAVAAEVPNPDDSRAEAGHDGPDSTVRPDPETSRGRNRLRR